MWRRWIFVSRLFSVFRLGAVMISTTGSCVAVQVVSIVYLLMNGHWQPLTTLWPPLAFTNFESTRKILRRVCFANFVHPRNYANDSYCVSLTCTISGTLNLNPNGALCKAVQCKMMDHWSVHTHGMRSYIPASVDIPRFGWWGGYVDSNCFWLSMQVGPRVLFRF